jgi:hypothetical protein
MQELYDCSQCVDEESLAEVQEGFKKGVVTKDEYANALRSYERMKDENE